MADIVYYFNTIATMVVLQLRSSSVDEWGVISLRNKPVEFELGDKVYFAVNEHIHGYFLAGVIWKGRYKNNFIDYKTGFHIKLINWIPFEFPIKIKDFRCKDNLHPRNWMYFEKVLEKLIKKEDGW